MPLYKPKRQNLLIVQPSVPTLAQYSIRRENLLRGSGGEWTLLSGQPLLTTLSVPGDLKILIGAPRCRPVVITVA